MPYNKKKAHQKPASASRSVAESLGSSGKSLNAVPALQKRKQDKTTAQSQAPIQRVIYNDMDAMWNAVAGRSENDIMGIINGDTALTDAYDDVAARLNVMDFIQMPGVQPRADLTPHLVNGQNIYDIEFGLHTSLQPPNNDIDRFVAFVLHEMMHISAALQYQNNVLPGGVEHGVNVNLPLHDGTRAGDTFTQNQLDDPQSGLKAQVATMKANWINLRQEVQLDQAANRISGVQANLIRQRITYAEGVPSVHYDTVLMDILYWMRSKGLEDSRSYRYANDMLTEANVRRRSGVGNVPDINRAPVPQQGGGCFITTACVEYMGMNDDCEELTLLRNFRDTYLLPKSNGPKLIELYYTHAPSIVTAIQRREDREEILERLYKAIQQCVSAIKNNDPGFAYRRYCEMMIELREEFLEIDYEEYIASN